MSKKNLNEILFHLGEDREKYFNAVAPPVIQSSNFAFKRLEDIRAALSKEMDRYIYTRGNNPTVDILRKKMAALANAEDALIFGSGSAAVAAAVISCVNAGDHIICVDKPYSWTKNLLNNFLSRFNVECTYIDARSIEDIESVRQTNTRLLLLESPNSFTFELQDLEACANWAKQHAILTCIDNSCATPYYQKPIDLGIDISVHAVTKYLNGHSDVMAGAVCASRQLIEKIYAQEYMAIGGVISPHDASLVIRGLRTFELRMQQAQRSGMHIAQYLDQHPKVEQVLYPFLPSFPQYELAKKQMSGAGSLFSIRLAVDKIEQVEDFFHQLKHFTLAASWGGYESLALPAVTFYKVPGRPDADLDWRLVRLYIGLEDPDWLIEDLAQALEVI